MKPALEFKLGQHLTITPQLQQAIRLLQLSSLELHQEIQEALDEGIVIHNDRTFLRNVDNGAGQVAGVECQRVAHFELMTRDACLWRRWRIRSTCCLPTWLSSPWASELVWPSSPTTPG